jgi:hypothetical protein
VAASLALLHVTDVEHLALVAKGASTLRKELARLLSIVLGLRFGEG